MTDLINCVDTSFSDHDDATLIRYAEQLESLLSHEEKMLHPPAEVIINSIKQGLAAMCFDDNNNLIGFCRLIPVLGRAQINANSWDETLPDIYELGTVIVAKEHRGKKHGKELLMQLHNRFKDQLKRGEVLFMGTTTTIAMIGALKGVTSEETSVHYQFINPDEISYLGASTCVCESHHPPYGTGIQISETCDNRTEQRSSIPVENATAEIMSSGKCVMFYSNVAVALEFQRTMIQTFGEPTYQNRQRFANILNWNPDANSVQIIEEP